MSEQGKLTDGRSFPFFGALGKMRKHGWLPASREYFLASAVHGRYQMFEQGLAVWEDFEGIGDLGHPVATWPSLDQRARTTSALIAVFDLRGFTAWASNRPAPDVQKILELFESKFQDAFSREWCQQLFSKGTGDGMLVVSEAGNFGTGLRPSAGGFQVGHVRAFCLACARTVEDAGETLSR